MSFLVTLSKENVMNQERIIEEINRLEGRREKKEVSYNPYSRILKAKGKQKEYDDLLQYVMDKYGKSPEKFGELLYQATKYIYIPYLGEQEEQDEAYKTLVQLDRGQELYQKEMELLQGPK